MLLKTIFPRFNLRGSILNIDDRRHEVKYMCNKCGKLRVMFSLCDLKTEDLASKGYIEITDIHNCVESKLTPITLYVDASYSVRSQFPIEVEKTKTTEPLPGLDIPLPIKVKMGNREIEKIKGFRGKNIRSIKISDKLRQTNFILDISNKGNELSSTSKMSLVTVSMRINKKVSEENAKKWLEIIASTIETRVMLDETVLSHLLVYLEGKIGEKPEEYEKIEVEFLLSNSHLISNESLLTNFEENKSKIFPDWTKVEHSYAAKIIQNCSASKHKTLWEVYETVKDKQTLTEFLSLVRELRKQEVIKVEKMEFFTLSDPQTK